MTKDNQQSHWKTKGCILHNKQEKVIWQLYIHLKHVFQNLVHLYVCVLCRSVMSDSCNAINCSPPGSSVHGIFQARILEWVAISFSGDLPYPGIEPTTRVSWIVDSLPIEPFIIKYYYSTSGNKVKSIYFYTQGDHMLYCPYWDTF